MSSKQFENGNRITFLSIHAEKLVKNLRCVLSRQAVMYRNLENTLFHFYVRLSLNIPRLTKSREKRLRPSQECVGGRREGGCARDEVEDGIGIANIPLLYLSGLSSLCNLSLLSSIDHPSLPCFALTPGRVWGAYRGACSTESSLDDKSPDFVPITTGFKFNSLWRANEVLFLYRIVSSTSSQKCICQVEPSSLA